MTVKLNSGLLPPWIQDKTLLSGFLLDAQVLRHRQGVGRRVQGAQQVCLSGRGVFAGDSIQPWLSRSRRGLVHAGKGRVVGELGLQEVVSVHWH